VEGGTVSLRVHGEGDKGAMTVNEMVGYLRELTQA
jgi:hypothetical protein